MRLVLALIQWAASLTWAISGGILTFIAHPTTPGMADIGVALLAGGIMVNPLVLRLLPFRAYPTRLIVAFFIVVLAVVWNHYYRR